ncbi:hypothetical protein LDG_7360 [Legionella drancourtii LLAP12]|uniref:Uncharacterized protein n=1 Tax=Legionella drancourtii LLAP12 TaxID=658187 RepID=G9EQ17_9GAMM|nr:hypothetical protein LDG_7360 [Legionella drancourtii LLAP12]
MVRKNQPVLAQSSEMAIDPRREKIALQKFFCYCFASFV